MNEHVNKHRKGEVFIFRLQRICILYNISKNNTNCLDTFNGLVAKILQVYATEQKVI